MKHLFILFALMAVLFCSPIKAKACDPGAAFFQANAYGYNVPSFQAQAFAFQASPFFVPTNAVFIQPAFAFNPFFVQRSFVTRQRFLVPRRAFFAPGFGGGAAAAASSGFGASSAFSR